MTKLMTKPQPFQMTRSNQEQDVLLVNEKLANYFSFWMDGAVQQGMRTQHELFRCVATFRIYQRQDAFDLAWKRSKRSVKTVITVGIDHYTVWESLRSSTAGS